MPPTKKPPTKRQPAKPKIQLFDFAPYLEKYKDKFYTNSKNQTEIPVAVQFNILTEACRDWKLNFNTEIINATITSLFHSITSRVSIVDLDGKTLKSADGISTKYAYDYVALAAKSASEVADTISTGRALAKLGINIEGKFSTQEEMDVFRHSVKKPLDNTMRDAATLFANCPASLKKSCEINNISIKDMVSLVAPANNDSNKFATLLENHIAGLNGERKI